MENNKNTEKACFLDRDGVLIYEKNYLHLPEEVEIIECAFDALAILRANNYKIIVITNQAGVARGYFKEEDIGNVHREIDRQLGIKNLFIDAYYYCPHHESGIIKDYSVSCDCRKPNPGMILKACTDFNLDPSHSFMVGDKMSDVYAARNAGIDAILVETGYGEKYKEQAKKNGFSVEKNLLSAVNSYLNNLTGKCRG